MELPPIVEKVAVKLYETEVKAFEVAQNVGSFVAERLFTPGGWIMELDPPPEMFEPPKANIQLFKTEGEEDEESTD